MKILKTWRYSNNLKHMETLKTQQRNTFSICHRSQQPTVLLRRPYVPFGFSARTATSIAKPTEGKCMLFPAQCSSFFSAISLISSSASRAELGTTQTHKHIIWVPGRFCSCCSRTPNWETHGQQEFLPCHQTSLVFRPERTPSTWLIVIKLVLSVWQVQSFVKMRLTPQVHGGSQGEQVSINIFMPSSFLRILVQREESFSWTQGSVALQVDLQCPPRCKQWALDRSHDALQQTPKNKHPHLESFCSPTKFSSCGSLTSRSFAFTLQGPFCGCSNMSANSWKENASFTERFATQSTCSKMQCGFRFRQPI